MKNILVPIDFSIEASISAEYAAELAHVFDARIILINAIPPPIGIGHVEAVLISQKELLLRNKKLMAKVMERFSKKYAIKVESIVREAFPSDLILDMAAAKNADIIVMATKGKGKSNLIFGSTTSTVMGKSKIPVLVIPENIVFKSINCIALATDFEADNNIDNYHFLREIIKKYDPLINVIKVQKNEYAMTSRNVAAKMETDLLLTNSKHRFFVIENDNVEEGIHEFLKAKSSDMLVMFARKHGVLKRIFGTIHTREMSFQTRLPLLVLPAK